MPREAEWDARWWSPIINAEHLAMRERAGYVDLSAFVVFDVVGRGRARRRCSASPSAQIDVAPGRVVYTPIIDERGGFRADLTIMRLGDDHFRVVTGGAHGNLDRKWFRDHLPADGSAQVVDLTSAFTTIGLWGPRARDILGSLTDADVSQRGVQVRHLPRRSRSARWTCSPRASPTSASSAGSCTLPIEQGARLWDLRPRGGHAARRGARSASACTARPAASRRATAPTAPSSTAERTIVEAGMQRPKVKDADFIGREAYLKQRDNDPATVLCTLTVDDHTSATARKRYMLGGEPILARDGEPLTDGHGHHPYVTTAGSAPSLGKHVLMAYLPPDVAVVGTELAVEYLGEQYPVTVGSADATALFDPANERIRS